MLDGIRRAQLLGQRHGILHGHTASLGHIGCPGVSGVADQHHSTGVPAIEL